MGFVKGLSYHLWLLMTWRHTGKGLPRSLTWILALLLLRVFVTQFVTQTDVKVVLVDLALAFLVLAVVRVPRVNWPPMVTGILMISLAAEVPDAVVYELISNMKPHAQSLIKLGMATWEGMACLALTNKEHLGRKPC